MNEKLKNDLLNILNKLKISNGLYYLEEEFSIIVEIYDHIIEILNTELEKYNWLELHKCILYSYSDIINDMKQSNLINNYLSNNLKKLSFFIELNLIKKYEGTYKIDEESYKYLFDIVQFLYTLSEARSIINFTRKFRGNNIKGFYYLDVDINRINPIEFKLSDDYSHLIDSKINTYYEHAVQMKYDDSKELFENIGLKKEIENELGIDYFLLMTILNCLDNMSFQRKSNYIIEITYDELILKIMDHYRGNKNKEYIDKIERIIDFTILNTNEITNEKGKIKDYLSIDNNRLRKNRFDIRPIIKGKDNKLIFSTESLLIASNKWLNSIEYFNFPYEDDNLKESKKLLEIKKKQYEDNFTNDIENILIEKGYQIRKEVYFDKVLGDSNLEYLGDYDIIAINNSKKIILLIEAKFIVPSVDISHLISKQKEYYGLEDEILYTDINTTNPLNSHDKKQQRRINYFKSNYKDLLPKLNIAIDNNNEYRIISYMIFNRYFKPMFKKLEFEVLSFNELKKLLDNNNI